MQTSETIGQLAEALAKAQGEFTNPERNRTVKVTTKAKEGRPAGSYTFDYATFDAILAITRPILAKHGLAVIQGISTDVNKVTVTTRIAHSSGEWIQDQITAHSESSDLQSVGSACTYLKRYSYTAMLNIASEEDDDGNAAAGNDAEKNEKQKPACPKCGKTNFVYSNKPDQGPGWFCWSNKEKQKFGCGHKWIDEPEQQPPLTEEEATYIAEVQKELLTVDTLPKLEAIGFILATKSEAIKRAARPLYESKLKVLKSEGNGKSAA